MSSLTDILAEIDSLRSQLDKLKPMKAQDEERLWKKFRLEWNYNSNHIEGSTLTYGQTELLLMFDKTTGDHEMREYEEMKAHDAVIHLVREFAKDKERELTEADIRQWNKTILVRPFWSDAQTQSGQPTKKQIIPGEYKKEPNSVRLQNGEMFHYASPEETPLRMNNLINWYREEVKKKELHPVQLAALLHYKFVLIHPFDDSNGRTSRLLMNYELLRNELPPVIIKSADKKNYLFALNKADVGDTDAFVEYIANQIMWSLELSIKATKGESIEELDDVDKEIEVIKKGQSHLLRESVSKAIDKIEELYDQSIEPLFKLLFEKHTNVNDFFASNQYSVFYDNNGAQIRSVEEIPRLLKSGALKGYRNQATSPGFDFSTLQNEWMFQYYHANLKIKPDENIYFNGMIKLKFLTLRYEVSYKDSTIYKKKYSEILSKEEINKLVNLTLKELIPILRQG